MFDAEYTGSLPHIHNLISSLPLECPDVVQKTRFVTWCRKIPLPPTPHSPVVGLIRKTFPENLNPWPWAQQSKATTKHSSCWWCTTMQCFNLFACKRFIKITKHFALNRTELLTNCLSPPFLPLTLSLLNSLGLRYHLLLLVCSASTPLSTEYRGEIDWLINWLF